MNDLRKAAEMALEALEWISRVNAMDYEYQRKAQKPIQALRKALTPAPDVDKAYTKLDTSDRILHKKWVGLTEEEIFQAYKPEMEGMPFNKPTLAVIAGYIEAKLKEKNT